VVKKTLLFSDVHLKVHPADRSRLAGFRDFLRGIEPGEFDRIICLGDLFDFWFEYRHVIFSGYFEVLRVFAELRDAGIAIHLVAGNHDFWAGRFLSDELGFIIHPDQARLPFGDREAMLVHGDGINPEDRAYRLYKRIARNPLVINLFRLIHPDLAMAIARGVSHSSRTMLGVEEPAHGPEAKAQDAWARNAIAKGVAPLILCGHAHAPCIREYPAPGGGTGLYINPGDWLHHRSHVVWDGENFHLHEEEAD
jgi:UDP-2,3-diacylglucosamine hydrolase